MTKTILSATLALGLLACGKGEGEKKEPEPPATAPTTPPATDTPAAGADPAAGTDAAAGSDPAAGTDPAAGADPAAGGEAPPPEAAGAGEVPTREDFEEKATKDLDQKNLESEVSKMEKELGVQPDKK